MGPPRPEGHEGRVGRVDVRRRHQHQLAGSLLTASLPAGALPWILLSVSLLTVARGLGWLRWTPGPRSLAPAGFVAGGSRPPAAPASSSPPLLLAAGLRGDAFIATASASAFAMHVARIVGYGSAGLVSASTLGASAVLAVGLIGGNLAGRRLRGVLGDAGALRVTYGVMVTMVALALAGVA